MLIFKIAYRNLFRHRGKSLVVGIILFIGAVFMIVGGSTVAAMEENVTKAIIDSFIGDITIMSRTQEKEDILTVMMGDSIALIPDYPRVRAILDETEKIDRYLPYGYGIMMMLAGNDNPTGYPAICAVFGADLHDYQEMFGNFETLEGTIPPRGSRGIYLSQFMRDMYYLVNQDLYYPAGFPFITNYLKGDLQDINPAEVTLKHDIVLMGYSSKNATSDVKVPVKGIFRYKALHSMWRELSVMDMHSFRECMNYIGADEKIDLDTREAALLSADIDNPDSFFSSVITENMVNKPPVSAKKNNTPTASVHIPPAGGTSDPENGVFELISVKLRPEYKKNPDAVIDDLNRRFESEKLGVKALNWKQMLGSIVTMLDSVKIILYATVGLVFVVAVIIIMNTLAMSVLERSQELGMMRAIGARRSFLAKMLLYETFTLSFFFGGLGICAGIVITKALAALRLPVKNEMLQIVTGADYYAPLVTVTDVGIGVIMLICVTFGAVIYPLRVSRSITPMSSMSRN